MSATNSSGEESTATTDAPEHESAALATIATVGLGDGHLPDFEVYERAAWATHETIERVAVEEM